MKVRLHAALALCLLLLPACAMADDIAIRGAKVYPAPDAAPVPDAVILIQGNRILAVGPRRDTPIPKGFKVLDATGAVVTAGFWNSHVHLIASGLLNPAALSNRVLSATLQTMFTQWGFTTVFDLASTTASATAIRSRVESGSVAGPHILTVGEPFYPPGGTPFYARPIYRDAHLPSAEITTQPAAVARVSRQVAAGANGIKLFTGAIVGGKQGVLYMSAGDIRAITTRAHQLGLQTFAHPTDSRGATVAIDNGVDILAHTDPLSGPWSAAFVAKLRAKHVALIPTLTLFQSDPDPRTPVETSLQQLRAQAQSGGDVIFGTDAGFTNVYDPTMEYRLMGRVLEWKGILASLTTTPARRFGQGDRTGKVLPGFTADLVVLTDDPARDVANLAHVQNVFSRGRLIYSAGRPPHH